MVGNCNSCDFCEVKLTDENRTTVVLSGVPSLNILPSVRYHCVDCSDKLHNRPWELVKD